LLGFLANPMAVGFYTASIKFIKLLLPFVTSVGTVFIPVLAHKFAENKIEEIQKILIHSFYFLVLLTVPMAFGTYLLSPEIITIFSGEAFNKSILPMQIMSVLPLFIGFGHFFAFQILIPAEKNKEVFIAMLVGLIISALFNFLLAPYYQEKGAAIAIIITELSVTLIYFYYTNRVYQFKYPWVFFGQSIIAACSFIPIVFGVRMLTDNTFIICLMAIIGCSLTYILLQLYLFNNKFLITYINFKQIITNLK
jgi:O-antigen/teichoic acid export membrane protein